MNAALLAEANRLRLLAVQAGDDPDLHRLADLEMARIICAHALDRANARLARREQDRAADQQAAGESREVQS